MKFDDLGSVWQEANSRSLSAEEREAMVARVCRRAERLEGSLTRRDLRESLAALFVIVFFGSVLMWSDMFLAKMGAGMLVGWAFFIIWKMYRTRAAVPSASVDAPVGEYCRIEIERLDRQARLLRSVFWWYIAPCMIGANLVFIGTTGLDGGAWATGAASLGYLLFTVLLSWGLYHLNRNAVDRVVLPARAELTNLMNQLDGEDSVAPISAHVGQSSTLGEFLSFVVLMSVLAAFGAAAAVLIGDLEEHPKRAPFTAVRWEMETPVVEIDGEWYTLVALDGIEAKDIVAFCKRTYPTKWQKRFSEDLVEVLTRMGHKPGWAVQLVVLPVGSKDQETLENVRMTRANRRATRNANPPSE